MLWLCGCGGPSARNPVPAPASPLAAAEYEGTAPAAAQTIPPAAAQPIPPAGAQPIPAAAAQITSPAAAGITPPAAVQSAVEDGRYAGLSVLTAFHGDCNAGGTGEIVVRGRALTYRDARNPALSGLLGDDGDVDLSSGGVHLTGRFAAMVFNGRIAGGPCEYQMRFERVAG